MSISDVRVSFNNSFAQQLEGFYVPSEPMEVREPRLLQWNEALAESLGIGSAGGDEGVLAASFSGQSPLEGWQPLAQAYAGHQFGNFVPQLGDGRALLLGEHVDASGKHWDIALKGSGPTPFSRGGDGKAAVGPVLREYLISESMHALGVPTTRSLAAVATGQTVRRMQSLPGAILTRVADSHIRVGTFQFFAARGRHEQVSQLANYVIARHGFVEMDESLEMSESERMLQLLEGVCKRQAQLVAQWMHVGFIHGVMNTDNMAIAGETIDYGPCAFMETYSPKAVFSSIDNFGRYAYENQPSIALWNLSRFAETLLPLIHVEGDPEQLAIDRAMGVLNDFMPYYESCWLDHARQKLGVTGEHDGDLALAEDWLELLHENQVDFTSAWRRLTDLAAAQGDHEPSLFPGQAQSDEKLTHWLRRWRERRSSTKDADAGAEAMQRVNPIFIPRNEKVEAALSAAEQGENEQFNMLLDAVRSPFTEQPAFEHLKEPSEKSFTECYQTFCGT